MNQKDATIIYLTVIFFITCGLLWIRTDQRNSLQQKYDNAMIECAPWSEPTPIPETDL